MSRSPSPYCIFSSRVAQRVSRGFSRGLIGASENRPSHFIPEMILFFSSVEGKFVFDEIAQMRSLRSVRSNWRPILFFGRTTSDDLG